MWSKIILTGFLFCFMPLFGYMQEDFSSDIFQTSQGDLKITFIGHGTLMFEFKEQVIHIDPYSRMADYSFLPKADLIVLTHEHGDHLDLKALTSIRTEKTILLLTNKCAEKVNEGIVITNGETKTVLGIKIEAVPAYNIQGKRDTGQPFHVKGEGNGYIFHFGDKRVYVAGDTENTPEMKALSDIDIAFLPMNLPYTMSPEMAADAVKAFRPKILYPYHYGNSDTSKLVELLKDENGIEVRIR